LTNTASESVKQNYQEPGVEAELNFEFFESYHFYRAMHFSAKRGIAIACRLSVCLSVCNVGEL